MGIAVKNKDNKVNDKLHFRKSILYLICKNFILILYKFINSIFHLYCVQSVFHTKARPWLTCRHTSLFPDQALFSSPIKETNLIVVIYFICSVSVHPPFTEIFLFIRYLNTSIIPRTQFNLQGHLH